MSTEQCSCHLAIMFETKKTDNAVVFSTTFLHNKPALYLSVMYKYSRRWLLPKRLSQTLWWMWSILFRRRWKPIVYLAAFSVKNPAETEKHMLLKKLSIIIVYNDDDILAAAAAITEDQMLWGWEWHVLARLISATNTPIIPESKQKKHHQHQQPGMQHRILPTTASIIIIDIISSPTASRWNIKADVDRHRSVLV